jgi:spore photoproduct lyase
MKLSRIFIDDTVSGLPVVQKICESSPGVPQVTVSDVTSVYDAVQQAGDPIAEGKRTLFITRNRGRFLRPCPGTSSYICCGYQILHIGTFCSMDCAYCILQAYFNPPVLRVFVNHDEMFSELNRLRTDACPFHRIGTGEFTDSLIWESLLPLSGALVSTFAGQDHAVLELKTKTVAIEGLAHLSHNRKTIMAWSLNTPAVIKREERRTTSLDARLDAAARAEKWGYPLAFHFDPLVIYDGWRQDYRQVIRRLFESVDPENIVWISIGSFRFIPSLKPIIQRRFSDSRLLLGEFIRGIDKKMRYFKPLRIEIYRAIVGWIKATAPDVCVYFCMEDEEVWQKVLGYLPEEKGGLSRILDESAARHCGLDIA